MQLESSVILFDDNKVEDRFAELQITADGITSEVSRKVSNDEVISRINQSAEGVQIQANKVNIEGAAIFSSGRLSQSSLNNAYDAKGAATGAVDNLKSDLSSSSGTTVINGGHIETGTLSAGAVNANSGAFDIANIPNLNASKITAGTIADSSGKNYWNLSSGQFKTQQGVIGPFTAYPEKLIYKVNNTQIALREGALSIRQRDFFTADPSTYYMFGTLLNGGYIFFYLADDGVYEGYSTKMKFSLRKRDGEDKYGIAILNSASEIVAGFFEDGAYTFPIGFNVSTKINANFSVTGTKSRQVETDNYSSRLLYCYETPTPLFGDIGEAVIDEDGYCYVDIDDIFAETIDNNAEYQVFLQKEGAGDCWIEEKTSRYFTIRGTPNLKVAWEIKAKQTDYQNIRLEQPDYGLDEYEYKDETTIDDYISEQEELLYGYY